MGVERKVTFIIDNCSAQLAPQELTSTDGKIIAIFLPPNVNSLIQPMDQEAIESVKRNYRKLLCEKMLIADEAGVDIPQFLKGIDLLQVI